jgi:multidrug resistance efflux pump
MKPTIEEQLKSAKASLKRREAHTLELCRKITKAESKVKQTERRLQFAKEQNIRLSGEFMLSKRNFRAASLTARAAIDRSSTSEIVTQRALVERAKVIALNKAYDKLNDLLWAEIKELGVMAETHGWVTKRGKEIHEAFHAILDLKPRDILSLKP